MVIDSHCHLHDAAFGDVADALRVALTYDVWGVIAVGCDAESNRRTLEIAAQAKKTVWGCLGFHPDWEHLTERDLETVESALRIAETGHLTLATLHTNSTSQTINRIIDIFPAHQQSQIRTQLSLVIEGIVCQALLPKIGGGRVVALEIMVPTAGIRNLIREDKIHQIYSMMQTGQDKFGMQTFNQALATLHHKKQITLDVAMQRSSNPDELKELIERGSGLNQSYAGQAKPGASPNGHPSPYAQGRPIGQRPPAR